MNFTDAESLALPSQSTSVLFENSFSRNHVENPIEVTQVFFSFNKNVEIKSILGKKGV